MNPVTLVRDPAAWLPYALYLLTLFAATGLALSLVGAKSAAESAASLRHFGANLFIGATLTQIVLGAWFFLVLPSQIRNEILAAGADAALLRGALASALLSLLIVRRNPFLALLATLVTTIGMGLARQRAQMITLEYFRESPVLLPVLISLALLAAGLALVAWKVWRDRRVVV